MIDKSNLKNKKAPADIRERIIDVYILAVLCVFPLFFTDAYFNILQSKYYFYIASVFSLAIAFFLISLIKLKQVATYFEHFSFKQFVRQLSVTDMALCAFLLIATMSTITSDYVYEAFWGNEGRYSGLFLLILYGLSYFLITRFGKLKRWHMDAFLVSGVIMCLIGISDYFRMDVLGMKQLMKEAQKTIFTSTIGNINTYTAIVGMLTAISAVLFAGERKASKAAFYAISMIINMFALIMGISDNAYLSLGALLALLPLYLFKNRQGIRRYIIILAFFFSVVQCIDWINTSMGERVVGIDGAFNIITNFSGLLFIVIILWAVVAALHFLLPSSDPEHAEPKWPLYLWSGILVLCFVGMCLVLWDANFAGHAARYEALSGYLVFNDDWGTHRGYIWRNALECYQTFSPWKKFAGYGPDTFGIVLLNKTEGNIYKEIFDTAHNEYLHYLITVGWGGLLAYLTFLISFCRKTVHDLKHNVVNMAILFGVVCYLTQAFVNLNLPIATPLMWTLLALGRIKIK